MTLKGTAAKRIGDGVTPTIDALLNSVRERGGFEGLKNALLEEIALSENYLFEKDAKGKSPFYAFVKTFYGEQEYINLVSDCLVACLLEDKLITEQDLKERKACVAVKGYGGAGISGALTSRWAIPQILVSDKASRHNGKSGSIFTAREPKMEDKVIVLDDTFDSGGSAKELIGKLRAVVSEIICCEVVQKRGYGDLEGSGVKLCCVFASDELGGTIDEVRRDLEGSDLVDQLRELGKTRG
jgi:orotate phosphoribosyltransferase